MIKRIKNDQNRMLIDVVAGLFFAWLGLAACVAGGIVAIMAGQWIGWTICAAGVVSLYYALYRLARE